MATASQVQTKQRPWWLTLITGIAALIVGGILLWAPAKDKVETYMLIVQLLGIYWLVIGIFDIVAIFIDHSMWGWKLFIGIVSIIAGLAVSMQSTAAPVLVICLAIGLKVPRSGVAHDMAQARQIMDDVRLPCCIRPAYTLGGTGGGFAFNVAAQSSRGALVYPSCGSFGTTLYCSYMDGSDAATNVFAPVHSGVTEQRSAPPVNFTSNATPAPAISPTHCRQPGDNCRAVNAPSTTGCRVSTPFAFTATHAASS